MEIPEVNPPVQLSLNETPPAARGAAGGAIRPSVLATARAIYKQATVPNVPYHQRMAFPRRPSRYPLTQHLSHLSVSS
jgi:hypothetical protein